MDPVNNGGSTKLEIFIMWGIDAQCVGFHCIERYMKAVTVFVQISLLEGVTKPDVVNLKIWT